nr:GGDEF domain-containing protein [uncultured Cellulosilyticum sp.]
MRRVTEKVLESNIIRILILIIAIGILGLGWIINNSKVLKTNKLVRAIEKNYLEEEKIDNELFESILSYINQKQEESFILDEKDYFILGYKYYQEDNKALAIENLQLSSELMSEKTDTFIKIYNGTILSDFFLGQGQYEKAVISAQNTLEQISPQEFGKRYDEVIKIIGMILYIPGGREVGIVQLEEVLQDASKLTIEQICDIKNKLAVMYLYNGNYAKGFEKCLEVITMKEKISNQYYVAKAYVDLGILYGSLGDTQSSKGALENALNIEIEDAKENALIKSYALINLYSSAAIEENYEQLMEIDNKVEEYSSLLSTEVLQSIQVINNAMLVGHYSAKGDISKGEELLRELKEIYGEIEEPAFSDIDIFYYKAIGDFMLASGNIEEAVKNYDKVLDMCENNGNPSTAKDTLTSLISGLNAVKQYERANIYEERRLNLLAEEAILVNRDYSEYALYKYEFETKQMRMTAEKIRRYIIVFIIILVSSIIWVIAYMKYTALEKLHKTDALTKAYNRYYFNERYKLLVESMKDFQMIMFDIDNFKRINDNYGHTYGDHVIKTVVNLCQGVIEDKGDLYRYGGEEFVVVLENATIEKAIEIAEDMRKAIAYHKWEQENKITISIGVAETTETIRDILEKADKKLYCSKKTGKNKITY